MSYNVCPTQLLEAAREGDLTSCSCCQTQRTQNSIVESVNSPLLASAYNCILFARNCCQNRRTSFKFNMQLSHELHCASDVCRNQCRHATFLEITCFKSIAVRMFGEKRTIVEYQDLQTGVRGVFLSRQVSMPLSGAGGQACELLSA